MTPRTVPTLAATVAATLLCLSLSAPGSAQRAAASREVQPRFGGHYRYAESDARGQERIRAAARSLLSQLNPITRLIAEARINGMHVPPRIDLQVSPAEITTRFVGYGDDEDHSYQSRPGYPNSIVTDSGRDAELTQHFRGGRLEQIFEGERGRWYNLFALDESGEHLRLEIVLTGERLDTPIRVELPYRRIPG